MRQGIDYSFGRPGGAAIAAAGCAFALRYVPYPGNGGKGITREEMADLQSHGIAIGLVFESTAGRALDGAAAGVQDALVCVTSMSALGWPSDRPFYFAVDFDATARQLDAIDVYLAGAITVLGADRVGVYGSYAVVEHCLQSGSASWLWQTYAWSHGRRSPAAHLYQYLNGQTLNGAAVDLDEALDGDVGLWPHEEEGMTDDECYAIFGSTENLEDGTPDWPTRHANARYRLAEAAAGRAPTVRDLATTGDGSGTTTAEVIAEIERRLARDG